MSIKESCKNVIKIWMNYWSKKGCYNLKNNKKNKNMRIDKLLKKW